MNTFELNFFKKYVPEWQEMCAILHQHWTKILSRLIILLTLWVLIPVLFYYSSFTLRSIIPFYFLEWYLYLIYLKIVYDIFDRYNDVWIITDQAVVDLDRSLFRTKLMTLTFDNIEWMEVEQSWIIDKVLKKGDFVLHKVWEESFVLYDCIRPFDALNEMERIQNEQLENTEEKWEHFDVIMDALGSVVENYLEKWELDKKEVVNKVNNIQEDNNTIDLR